MRSKRSGGGRGTVAVFAAAILATAAVGVVAGCGNGDGGNDTADAADAGGAQDWLKGWQLLGKDAAPVGNLTSVWSNGKAGAEREWLVVGGTTAGDKAGVVWELRGDTWKRHDLPGTGILWWVHGDADGRRMAVGDGGSVVRWQSGDTKIDAAFVDSLKKDGSQLFGVWWAQGGEDFYVVGGNAMGSQQTGILWRVPLSAATHDIDTKATKEKLDGKQGLLMKLWGFSDAGKETVFAVGEGGAIWAGNADGWKLDGRIDAVDRFIGVTGKSATDVIAVGGLGSGKVARRDAKGWRLAAGCKLCFINGQLAAVLLGEDGTAIVGGSHGYLARQKEDTDQDLPLIEPPLSELDLHGAWYDGHTAVVVGGNLSNPSVAAGAILYRGEALPELPAK